MPIIKVAKIENNKGKVVFRKRIPSAERGPQLEYDTKAFMEMIEYNPGDRDFFLEDMGWTYEELLMMVALKLPFSRHEISRMMDIFGAASVAIAFELYEFAKELQEGEEHESSQA